MITKRQYEVARLYAAGHPRKEVARRLGITACTVRAHIRLVYARLGVTHRRHLATALMSATIGERSRENKFGFRPGQLLRVVGGRRAGRTGTFVRLSDGKSVILRIGAADVLVMAHHCEAVDDIQAAA